MALQDILDAIIAQADQQITSARSGHQKRISEMREAAERSQAKKKQDLAMQKEKKKAQMQLKAQAHAETSKRNTVLQKKRELLDQLYSKTLEQLAALPDDKVEPVLRTCLKSITTKGTLHPSEAHAALLKKIAPSEQFTMGKPVSTKGGFIFSSPKAEQDCTLEHLVKEWLRPQTELDVSQKLFS